MQEAKKKQRDNEKEKQIKIVKAGRMTRCFYFFASNRMAMNFPKLPNANHLWSSLIIEELIRNGVDYFCLAPGSRSSPLAVAVATNPRAKSFVHFDERALAFHALGYASAPRKACAVITTSGTAAANLFPAVIEASKKKLPLVILTADRPPELRYTGANQTIDQVKMFGDYVRWQFDMPCPTADIPANFVLTTIDQAVFRANGEVKGPVHINCMYREPLFDGNNIGTFWFKNKYKFPLLTSLARKYSILLLSSLDAETTFSMVGNICTEKRTSINADNLEMLAMSKYNFELVDQI
jgi:2-succinyl-5-enolpyruvyl-6-hydroxy-3-cyclohexene-1-carboxylate synthase